MAEYTQLNRFISVTTPLGPDALLLVGFSGQEAISQLFHFQLDLMAEKTRQIQFDQLLGQKVSIEIIPHQSPTPLYLSGICSRVSQGERDATFTAYRMDVVPQFWRLTLSAQSRIFQQMTVLDILKEVLKDLDVVYEIDGDFHPRDYCVQYRETDFNFASRLMEEEGIYYFFQHTADGDQMVVANIPDSHRDVPVQSTIIYEDVMGGERAGEEARIYDWEKSQELRAGKVTLWDHSFELPHKHLEAEKNIQPSVQVGTVTHQLQVGGNDKFEIYDFQGEYAQRFDGVTPGGGDRAGDLQKIFEDNRRTTGIRMQEEALPSIQIQGASSCRNLLSGHKFRVQGLDLQFDGNGEYVLTSVQHSAHFSGDFRSGQGGEDVYNNSFTCIPAELPFRPQRTTPKPFVQGTQTAIVVGPDGQEIFTDKYGRVKVQFHWDRDGTWDGGSSCWVRVGHAWAGKRWGSMFIPRIGQEVIVAFQEGDPDQPIIIGSVYNAEQMPAYLGDGPDPNHPHNPNLSGIKTNTTLDGDGFNELRFDDTKDLEQVFIHAERNMDTRVKLDSMERVINDRHLIVGQEQDGQKMGEQRELVHLDKHLNIKRHHTEKIEGNMFLTVGKGEESGGNQDIVIEKDKKELIEQNSHLHVKSGRMEKIDGSQSLTVGVDQEEKIGSKHTVDAGQEIHLKAGMKVVMEAGMELTIKAAGGFIKIDPSGVTVQGTLVRINSGGAAGSGSGSSPSAPQDAQEAVPIEPTEADNAVTGSKSISTMLPPPPPGDE